VNGKRACAALVACLAVALAGVSSGVAANNSNQTGLVNVSLGDVNLLNNVNLGVAANVVANACGVNIPVAVLSTQVISGAQEFTCRSAAGPINVTQSQNGAPTGTPNAGGNNSNQSGLVNVSVGDVNLLNNLNAAIGANIAINVCGVNVPVAVLAQQLAAGSTVVTCDSSAGPVTIQPA
jgi:hypothetical protein